MRKTVLGLTVISLLLVQSVIAAQGNPEREGVPLAELLARASERLNKNFIVDPRVSGQALMFGIDPERITYRELQAVLAVHGFVTTQESNGLIAVVPAGGARQLAQPVLSESNANVGKDEVVTRILEVAPLDAGQLVPVLRPMMPQEAHLVSVAATNSLIIVDRHDNVRRIEAVINDLRKRPTVPTRP